MGDRAALDRLFVNLIQNAIQHGGKSGAISIRLSEQGTVEVEDEGPGIAEDKRERIFDAFYRINGHGGGSGLGLKIVRDIAREHGGDVTLQATGGAGSKFRVYLPYDGQPASRQTPGIFLSVAKQLISAWYSVHEVPFALSDRLSGSSERNGHDSGSCHHVDPSGPSDPACPCRFSHLHCRALLPRHHRQQHQPRPLPMCRWQGRQ
ncbi:sensor histidine kinase [Agrobacterium pusense]|uniref:sensor histidine kinase n=1 Tax=Agrobacterium pusense TaxID=648995 RepID=UPI003FD5B0E6